MLLVSVGCGDDAGTGDTTSSASGGSNPGGMGGGAPGCLSRAGVCARDTAGVICGRSSGTAFEPTTTWQNEFSDANGWGSLGYAMSIRYPDVNGDGHVDVCGRNATGVRCALSDGTTFGPMSLWQASFTDANGWNATEHAETLAFPDVNGDGLDDLCGRGNGGIVCALSDGTTFGAVSNWQSLYSDANGWNASDKFLTIRFPDLDDDGLADVCGRGAAGVSCALSNGSSFGADSVWMAGFSDAGGWDGADHYATVGFPDVNGDNLPDVCGRSSGAIVCGISDGSTFGALSTWQTDFSNANGWAAADQYLTVRYPDVDGDGMDDVCGRDGTGVVCAVSDGTSFGAATLWQGVFSDASGWDGLDHYRTIRFPDLNGDGMADVCGKGNSAVVCALSDGTTFGAHTNWSPTFSDAAGWNVINKAFTIQYPDLCAP